MTYFEQHLQVLHQSPKYPEIAEACRPIGFNGDSSSRFWVMDEHIFYYDGFNWHLMAAFNEWVRDYDFAERLIYDSDVECAFPIPQELVEQYRFEFKNP